jgi:aryl-alcohol dehydrogenase-like predicted oxidoreductase
MPPGSESSRSPAQSSNLLRMRSVKVPGSALEVSAIAYGTADWGIAPETPVERLYATYREAGGNCFDTAHCYAFWRDKLGASERTLGQCIKANDRRSDLVLITKGGHPASDPQYPRPDRFLGPEVIESDVRESLERLGTDYIDLYFLHRDDPRAPVNEVMDALKPQVESGKLRYLGASHWSTARIGAANTYAAAHGMPPFVASQPGWNLGHPTPPAGPFGMKDRAWHEKSGLAIFAFSPTARGYFARGKDDQFDNPVSQARLSRATKLGQELGATANQIAVAWLMHQPFTVIPILGTLKIDHLVDALGAAAVTLSLEQVKWLEGTEAGAS